MKNQNRVTDRLRTGSIVPAGSRFSTAGRDPAYRGGGGGSWSFAESDTIGIYTPSGFGSKWRAALSGSRSSLAKVAVVGDSICNYWTSSIADYSFVGLLRKSIQSIYGDGGSGYKSVAQSVAVVAGMPVSDRVILTGSWTVGASKDGPGGIYLLHSPASASSATFTVRGSTVCIYYLSIVSLNCSFTYSIDGGDSVSVAPPNISAIQKIEVSSLSSGNHTVVISCGSNYLALSGVSGENSSGVVINDYSVSAKDSSQLINSSPIYGDPSLWSGGESYPADLVIYEYGVNDSNAGVSSTQYLANVASYLNKVKSAADVLIVAPHIGKFNSAKYPDYISGHKAAVLAENYGFVDLWERWGNSWQSFMNIGGWSNDTLTGQSGSSEIHPSNTGHGLYFNAIRKALSF